MGVSSANLVRDSEQATTDRLGRTSYEVGYRVIMTAATDRAPDVKNGMVAAGVPARGSILAGDPFSFLERYRIVRNSGDARWWDVTAFYEPPQPNEEDEDRFIHPLARPVRYRIEEEHFTEAVQKDKDNQALVNTAGFPYENGIEIERTRIVLVAEKNFGTLDEIINANVTFVGRVNSDTYRNQAARSWLVRSITSGEQKNEEGIFYYTATYRLSFNPDLWNHEILQTGFIDNTGIPVKRTSRDANEKIPILREVLLDVNGDETTMPFFVTETILAEVSFADIGV